MNILIVNTWYFPNLKGGAEQSVKMLAEGLAESNNVAVLTVDGKSEELTKEIINNVVVYRSNGNKYNLYKAYQRKNNIYQKIMLKYHEIFNKSMKNDIEKIMDDFCPTIIHFNCISGISLFAIQYFYKKDIPMVCTIRNMFYLFPGKEEAVGNEFAVKIIKKVYQLFTRYLTNKLTAVISPSNYALKEYSCNGFFSSVKRKAIIPNCSYINLDILNKEIKKKLMNHKLGTSFLYAGWVDEKKGIVDLVEAFIQLDCKSCNLVICGDGELSEYIKNKTKQYNNIIYRGKLSYEELIMEYKKNDVLVNPSHYNETFGRNLMEASACGMALICSDRGAMPEIVDNLGNGIVYQAGNVVELKKAMNYMIKNHTKYLTNISSGIIVYEASKHIEKHLELYNCCTRSV